ncbi:MAG TPA: hypothetical protein VIJ36_01375 [Thermoanaerobaculia bacterium]
MRKPAAVASILWLAAAALHAQAPKVHRLEATPSTVAVSSVPPGRHAGNLDNKELGVHVRLPKSIFAGRN